MTPTIDALRSLAACADHARDAVPTAILREIRKRRRLAYKLHAAGPCVFTLRDAAVLRERRKRRAV